VQKKSQKKYPKNNTAICKKNGFEHLQLQTTHQLPWVLLNIVFKN